MKTIKTKRCILRPFTLDDIEPSYLMNLDEEVTKYTNDGGMKSRQQMHDTIVNNVFGDYQKHGFGRFAVEDKATGKFIGFSGLKYNEEEKLVDIGYRFDKNFWGKGIATETALASLDFGFNELGLNRIYSWILPENIPSIRIMKKLNFSFDKEFTEDGILINQYVLEQHAYFDGG